MFKRGSAAGARSESVGFSRYRIFVFFLPLGLDDQMLCRIWVEGFFDIRSVVEPGKVLI